MKTKGKVLLSSIASIALCSSIAVGGTYALFTSNSEVSIAVTSGKVNVVANIDETTLKTYSMDVEQPAGEFQNGGTATLNEAKSELNLDLMSPGDKAEFKVNIANNSNIDIQYKVSFDVTGGLAEVLKCTATNADNVWTSVAANATIPSVMVTVELPEDVSGEEYMEKGATVTVKVEAIQANAEVKNYVDVTSENFNSTDFSKENRTFRLSGDFMNLENGIAIEELGNNSTLTFEGVAAASITLPDGATVTGENSISDSDIVGVGNLNFADGTLTITDGSAITSTAANAEITFDGMEVTSNAGISVENSDKTSGKVVIKDSDLALGGSLNVGASNGDSTLEIENSNVKCASIFVGGHMTAEESVATLNVKNSYVSCEENSLGSTISIWGKNGVEAQILDSEIHTYSRGWHQSEDANDNSITFQGGDHITVDIQRTNMHLYGARSIINARPYYDDDCAIDFTIDESLIWVVTKSNHGEETIPVWGGAEITDSILLFTKNAYSTSNPTVVKSFVYGDPVLHGDYAITTQCGWATDILLENQTLTLSSDANLSVYEGAAEVNFALSEGATLIVEEGATLTGIGVKAANGYQLVQNDDGSYTVASYSVSDAADLKTNLESGNSVTLTQDVEYAVDVNNDKTPYGNNVGFVQKGGVIDGNDNTLTVTGGSDTYAIMTYGGTIKNLTVDSGVRGIVLYELTENVILDNVVLDGPGYGINTGEAGDVNAKLIVTDSTLNGWNSFAGIASASFTNCSFGVNSTKYWENEGYASVYDSLVKPYVDTTFTNCSFDPASYIDLSALGADCTITFDNCTVNGVVLTAENYEELLDTIELPSGRTLADCVIFK